MTQRRVTERWWCFFIEATFIDSSLSSFYKNDDIFMSKSKYLKRLPISEVKSKQISNGLAWCKKSTIAENENNHIILYL